MMITNRRSNGKKRRLRRKRMKMKRKTRTRRTRTRTTTRTTRRRRRTRLEGGRGGGGAHRSKWRRGIDFQLGALGRGDSDTASCRLDPVTLAARSTGGHPFSTPPFGHLDATTAGRYGGHKKAPVEKQGRRAVARTRQGRCVAVRGG